MIRELAHLADVVVVDVAPTSRNADAQTLITTADGVLLVATAMKTTRDEILEAVDQFRHVSARVFGSVVVTVNRERHSSTSHRGNDSDGSRPTKPTSTTPRTPAPESSGARHEAHLMTVRTSAS
ncbi:hypothetical protein GJV80_14985 [Microlunatus sp. Gsoil 973]|nr:hypothetical protein GJV80_14985 [Microlunatus sp. Gsoil 973]